MVNGFNNVLTSGSCAPHIFAIFKKEIEDIKCKFNYIEVSREKASCTITRFYEIIDENDEVKWVESKEGKGAKIEWFLGNKN